MIKKYNIPVLVILTLFVLVLTPVAKASTVTIEADKQNFEVSTNKAHFNGNVKVNYDNIIIKSPSAILTSDQAGDPEKAVFNGGATALMKDKASTDDVKADQITLMLASNTMIAQGNSYSSFKKGTPNAVTIKADTQDFNSITKEIKASGSVVIHYKDMVITGSNATLINNSAGKPDKAKISGCARVVRGTTTITAGSIIMELNSNNFNASGGVRTIATLKDAGRVSMSSNQQMYNKASDIIIGTGNVNVVYQDYVATGPKATLYLSAGNSLNKIIFTGRSQIKETARKVTADVITVSIKPKNFIAEGNVKTEFITSKTKLKDAIKPDDKSKNKKNDPKKPAPKATPMPAVDLKKEPIKVEEPKTQEPVEPKQVIKDEKPQPAEIEDNNEGN